MFWRAIRGVGCGLGSIDRDVVVFRSDSEASWKGKKQFETLAPDA